MKKRIGLVAVVLLNALAFGCSHGEQGSEKAPGAVAMAAPQAMAPSAQAVAKKGEEEAFPENPPEKFTDGEKAFARVREALLKEYYLSGLTEDDIYRAATQGMLEHVDPKMHKWNKLLSPGEVALIRSDLKGEIVGIGVEVNFDEQSGHIQVEKVMPGSPADRAGLAGGDLIVSVNGKRYKGMTLHDAVNDIRGKRGDTVTLSVLREDKLLPFSITREVVAMDNVSHRTFGDGIGYVMIRGFSERTTSDLKTHLADLASKQPKALVVDLRFNQGGSFDEAVASAEQFLPAGTGIVTLKRRDGKPETTTSKGSPTMANLPMTVLVSHETSSGAEFLTAALQEGRHAKVVGAKTYGKWSVQTLGDLPNGYAFKMTTSQFFSPSGKSFDGVGLTPDVEVDATEEQLMKACLIQDGDKRIAADPQLRTAVAILTARP